jgi:hypothetical protein
MLIISKNITKPVKAQSTAQPVKTAAVAAIALKMAAPAAFAGNYCTYQQHKAPLQFYYNGAFSFAPFLILLL